MLRAARTSTANMKTTPDQTIFGLLAIGLLAQCGCGSAGNDGRGQREYVPPSAAASAAAATGHGGHQQQQQHTRYEIFEIHNHYVRSSTRPGRAGPRQSLAGNSQSGYLPPQREIHIHHIHSGPASALAAPASSTHNGNLDVSFLSFAATDGRDGQQITINAPLPAQSPPPLQPPTQLAATAIGVPIHSDYQRDFHVESAQRQVEELQRGGGSGDYLPPHSGTPFPLEHHYRQARPQQQQQQHQQQQQQHQQQQQPQQQQHQQQQHQQQQHQQQQQQYQQQQQHQQHQQHQQQQQQQAQQQQVQQQQVQQQAQHAVAVNVPPIPESNYKGPDYLPPHQEQQQQNQNHFAPQRVQQAPGYLPPHHPQHQQPINNHLTPPRQDQRGPTYAAPGYLPPHHQQQQQQQQQVQSQQGHVDYSGSDYLPPHRDQFPITTIGLSSGRAQHVNTQHATVHATSAAQQQTYHAPNYLPPQSANAHQQQQQYHHHHIQPQQQPQLQAQQYQAPQYLPPQHASAQQQQQRQPQVYKGPGYLPPYRNSIQQASGPDGAPPRPATSLVAPANEYAAPDYLPPDNGSAGLAQAQNLPEPAQDFQYPLPAPAPQNVALTQSLNEPLPHGYEFSKPANAEEAIAELHTLPQEPPEAELQQPFRHEQLRTALQSQQVAPHAAPSVDYLPPHQASISGAPLSQVAAHAAAADAQRQSSTSSLHSLSSYMTTVASNGRYADIRYTQPRRPFAKYGPAPPPVVDVAPMYSGHSARPQHYASAMSYTANTLDIPRPRSVLSEDVRQSLKAIMPKDVQAQIAASAGGKILTVQIIDPDSVKTLKVLETLDGAGVKTIKILGHSRDSPMGAHHVVKVVNGNGGGGGGGAHDHVQTVKIFDDQQDAAAASVAAGRDQAYLPPSAAAPSAVR